MKKNKKNNKDIFNIKILSLLSSMQFAILLLCILAIASIIGTLIEQNQTAQKYIVQYGIFWNEIFNFLDLYDVYSAWWFVLIMIFLVISTTLCILRRGPSFIKEIIQFRLNTNFKNLSLLKNNHIFPYKISFDKVKNYLINNHYRIKVKNNNNEIIISGKKGILNKLGYFFTHIALIILCVGGLLNSDLFLKNKIFLGFINPAKNIIYYKDFDKSNTIESNDAISYNGNINLPIGSGSDFIIINLKDNRTIMQKLPYHIVLKDFQFEQYENGMPKEFVSNVNIIDKETNEITNANIKVNHPLKIKNTRIYQSNYSNASSILNFSFWNLNKSSKDSKELEAKVMDLKKINFDNKQYNLSFIEFRTNNVENISYQEKNFQIKNIKSSSNKDDIFDFGPSISYSIENDFGITYNFYNYMLPRKYNNNFYYFYGHKKPNEEQYKWFGIPIDYNGELDTFFKLRESLADEKIQNKVAEIMSYRLNGKQKTNSIKAINNILKLFTIGGYQKIDEFINNEFSEQDKNKIGISMYQTIYIASDKILDVILSDAEKKKWKTISNKNQFITDSLQAISALNEYPVPIFLQLNSYDLQYTSVLQITKSPGVFLIYLGSLMLILGIFCMFYIRDRKIWVLIRDNQSIIAMSSNKNEQELQEELQLHIKNIKNFTEGKDNDKKNH